MSKSLWAIGDIHGDFAHLAKVLREIGKVEKEKPAIVQVGDLGYWPGIPELMEQWQRLIVPELQKLYGAHLCLIDGNHDDMRLWDKQTICSRWGTRLCLHDRADRRDPTSIFGRHVLFLGGSKSLDGKYRTRNGDGLNSWYPELEQITEKNVQDALLGCAGFKIDVMFTHTPPDSFIRAHFPKSGLKQFGIDPATWVDESALAVERVWNALGNPELICGHMHKSMSEGNVRVLGMGEYMKVEGV